MNNESYYGVTRSPEYLAHYGVRGMKWGVRKARESGNTAALSRHYAKAQAKLRRLSARADLNTINRLKKGMGKDAARDIAKSALASGGLTYGLNSGADRLTRLKYAGAAAGMGALASGLSYGIAGAQLHRLGSKKGHAKAVQKRDAWQREMNRAFRGTTYGKQQKQAPRIINGPKGDRSTQQAMNNWANAFEKHYQTGLSRGMTYEQAERYSNDYIAKHGFKPVRQRRRG